MRTQLLVAHPGLQLATTYKTAMSTPMETASIKTPTKSPSTASHTLHTSSWRATTRSPLTPMAKTTRHLHKRQTVWMLTSVIFASPSIPLVADTHCQAPTPLTEANNGKASRQLSLTTSLLAHWMIQSSTLTPASQRATAAT